MTKLKITGPNELVSKKLLISSYEGIILIKLIMANILRAEQKDNVSKDDEDIEDEFEEDLEEDLEDIEDDPEDVQSE